ncbi:SAM-dependent methyltransferase [Embleya sp. NPDC008237]|uniref:SAM-dependent methyltransferase n=1 Tax=Embleya sp. NPDC008237 TaxID=3363978 RepID=UPI0036F0AFD1
MTEPSRDPCDHRDFPLSGAGLTALTIAVERNLESRRPDRLFDDHLAAAFLAPVDAAGAALPAGFAPRRSLGGRWAGIHGFIGLRTRLFDDQLLAATHAGGRQVVLLGAGLDTRAFRLPWPPGVRVFELDREDVLRYKAAVLARARALPRCHRVSVAVDLGKEWAAALCSAGFDPALPTAWVAESLLLYLGRADCDQLIARIGALSQPGSRLVLDHVNAAMMQTEEFARMAHELARIGVAWRSSIDDPLGWLAGFGWHADLVDVESCAAALGRPVPPVLAANQRLAQRLWLVSARR